LNRPFAHKTSEELIGCGQTNALYQGIALTMPELFEIGCPFSGWTSGPNLA
jgi:hypothetical protein